MKAMILAGGFGTRLRPLTNDVPKPMLPVNGMPILWYVINHLKAYGFDEIIINVGYLKNSIIKYIQYDLHSSIPIQFIEEDSVSGSAGAISKAREFFNDEEDFLVVNGDVICDFDLSELWRFHKQKQSLATLSLFEKEEVDQFGVVILSNDKKIQAFQEKPQKGLELSHLINAGIYAFNKKIFECIPELKYDGEVVDLAKDIFPNLISKDFYGLAFHPDRFRWRDIGSLKDYEEANR